MNWQHFAEQLKPNAKTPNSQHSRYWVSLDRQRHSMNDINGVLFSIVCAMAKRWRPTIYVHHNRRTIEKWTEMKWWWRCFLCRVLFVRYDWFDWNGTGNTFVLIFYSYALIVFRDVNSNSLHSEFNETPDRATRWWSELWSFMNLASKFVHTMGFCFMAQSLRNFSLCSRWISNIAKFCRSISIVFRPFSPFDRFDLYFISTAD